MCVHLGRPELTHWEKRMSQEAEVLKSAPTLSLSCDSVTVLFSVDFTFPVCETGTIFLPLTLKLLGQGHDDKSLRNITNAHKSTWSPALV